MHLIYRSDATPTSAFFEGLVRVFDWWSLVLFLRRKQRRFFVEDDDPDRSRRVIDSYVRDSIATFELEEADKLSDVPIIPRRVSVVADTMLGSLPTDDVIIYYEGIVPGAVDRIMERASDRLKRDSEAELKFFDSLCRQGYRGMVAGFILTMLLGVGALALVYTNFLWPGLALVGTNVALVACSIAYVSWVGLRCRWFTGEFFPKAFRAGSRCSIQRTYRQRRPAV